MNSSYWYCYEFHADKFTLSEPHIGPNMRLYAVFSFGAMPSKILKVKKVKNIPWKSPINCLHAHIITFVLTGRHHTYLDFRNIACTTPCVNPMRVSARAKKLSTKKAEVPWPQWAPHAPVTWYRYLLRPVLYGLWSHVCFPQVTDVCICTCARAHPFFLSQEQLDRLRSNLVCG